MTLCLLNNALKFTKLIKTPTISCFPLITANKNMSVWSPQYLEPVFDKEKLKGLKETGETERMAHLPIKPPNVYETSSELYDEVAAKLCNYVMKAGKRPLARELVAKTFETIKRTQIERYHKAKTDEEKQKIDLDPLVVLHKAVQNTMPMLQITPVKRGAVKYQVPSPITQKRSRFVAMRWLVQAGNDKEDTKRFYTQLAYELIDASQNKGRVVKQKLDLHKNCEANRAYAHYRWT